MADGLLNKASIILTPTGYKAGTLYNVAPVVEPYEDFDFARASVASRVNSSGLVEMVGRTLSSEVLTNGDFSTPGTPNSTSWSLGWTDPDSSGNVSISSGQVSVTRVTSSTKLRASNGSNSSNVLTSGKKYKLTYTVVSNDTGTGTASGFIAIFGAGDIFIPTSVGTHTVYAEAVGTFLTLRLDGQNNSIIVLDNVSLKEIIDTNNIPRISYDSNGANGHILLEPTSTNLVTYSEDFSQSFWNQTTADVTVTTNTNPSGTSGTYSVKRVTGSQLGASFTVTSGNDYTASWYVRNISGSGAIIIKDTNNSTNNFTATSEWQRFSVTATASSATGRCYIQVSTVNDVIEVWGAQFEEGSYATSYIPSLTGSQEVRATETATGAGSADLINSTEGVLYAEIADITNDNLSDNNIISISKSTDEDFRVHIALKTNGTIQGFIREGAGNTKLDVSSTTVLPSTSFFKVAVLFESGNNKLYVNGLQIGSTNTSSFSNLQLNSLQFNRGDDDKIFYGKCKALAVFNEALSDDELNNLTG